MARFSVAKYVTSGYKSISGGDNKKGEKQASRAGSWDYGYQGQGPQQVTTAAQEEVFDFQLMRRG